METQNKTKEAAWIILRAVATLHLGKETLARFLKGSKSKKIAHMTHEKAFGGLLWCHISTIEGFIEQLEQMNLIERKIKQGYPYPYSVYTLTDAGKKAMQENIKVSLLEVKKQEPITVGESEKQTFELFKRGKKINEIAKERNLAESTVYTHFYRLIVNDYLQSSDAVPKDIHALIKEVCARFEKQPPLREIKEQLPPEITYDQIRCVAAGVYKGAE